MLYLDESVSLQLLDGASHRAAGDTAGLRDGLPAWVATVFPVIAFEQVAVDVKFDWRQLLIKDFVLHYKEISHA